MNFWLMLGALTVLILFLVFIFGIPRLPFFKAINEDFLECLSKAAIYLLVGILGIRYLNTTGEYYLNVWVCIISFIEALSNFRAAHRIRHPKKSTFVDNIKCLLIVYFILWLIGLLLAWFFLALGMKN